MQRCYDTATPATGVPPAAPQTEDTDQKDHLQPQATAQKKKTKCFRPGDAHSYLWVVRDNNWSQIIGVYDWQGLITLLERLMKGEYDKTPLMEQVEQAPVMKEMDGPFMMTLTFEAISAVNRTRLTDDELQILGNIKCGKLDLYPGNRFWHYPRPKQLDAAGGFSGNIPPQILTVDQLLSMLQDVVAVPC